MLDGTYHIDCRCGVCILRLVFDKEDKMIFMEIYPKDKGFKTAIRAFKGQLIDDFTIDEDGAKKMIAALQDFLEVIKK